MCLPCSCARVSWLCCSELSLRISQVDDTWRPLWGRSRAQNGRDPMILPPRPQSPWQPATMLPSFCFSTSATSHLSQFRPLHINSYNFHLSWKRCQYHFVFRKYFRKKKIILYSVSPGVSLHLQRCRDHSPDRVSGNIRHSARKCVCAKIHVGNIG